MFINIYFDSKNRYYFFGSIKCFLLVFICCISTFSQAQNRQQIISEKLTIAFQENSLPDCAMAIVAKDSILYMKAFGYADRASRQPLQVTTLQNIGSISKTLIGVSLMKLVDDGKLNLDTPINDFLPFKVNHPKFNTKAITLRHLATHSSGIKDTPNNYDLKSYYLDTDYQKGELQMKGYSLKEKIFLKNTLKNKPIPLKDFLKMTLSEDGAWYNTNSFYDFEPGSVYEYSNLGATLAAYIVEIVSGKSYDKFTRDEIIKPLKMIDTGWFYKDVDMTRFTSRYIGKHDIVAPFYELITYPDGGLKTTIADLSLFLQEMMRGHAGEGKLLSKTSYEQLFANSLQVEDGEERGIFWDVFEESPDKDIGHSGNDPGIYCFMYFNPKTGIGHILFTNSSGKSNEKRTVALWEKLVHIDLEL